MRLQLDTIFLITICFARFPVTNRPWQTSSHYSNIQSKLIAVTWTVSRRVALCFASILLITFDRVTQFSLPQIRDEMADIAPSEELISIHDINDRWPCRYKFSNIEIGSETDIYNSKKVLFQ